MFSRESMGPYDISMYEGSGRRRAAGSARDGGSSWPGSPLSTHVESDHPVPGTDWAWLPRIACDWQGMAATRPWSADPPTPT